MTSPAAADGSTVTAFEPPKKKKETRRQRAAREVSERVNGEADAEVSTDDITEADAEVSTDDIADDGAEAETDADRSEETESVEPGQDREDATPDKDPDSEPVDDAGTASDEPGSAAAAPSPETRKQRKARQAIEEAKAEQEVAEAKAAAIAAKQATEAAEKKRAAEQAATTKARMARGTKRWLRRLAFIAVIGGIGVGAYLAWPTVNERYVQPVESTAADVDTIQTDVLALQDLTNAESGRLADLITDLSARTDELDADAVKVQSTVDSVVQGQAEIDTRLGDLDARFGDLESLIGDTTQRIDGIDALATELGTTLAVTNSNASAQLTVMRSTELLSRSRLLLYQANYGLAAADLTAARTALTELPATPLLTAAIARLDLALLNLPARPVAAAGDIDIAWAALLAGSSDALQPADSFIPPPAEQAGNDTTNADQASADGATAADSAEETTAEGSDD